MNKIYIVDFLNIFSDFREIKYKKNKIDFHNVKYHNLLDDSNEFFNMFFTKYIQFANIDSTCSFIFVLKKIKDFKLIIEDILIKYSQYNIRFVVIENKFNVDILDKNKDDFLCQYFFHFLQKRHDCILISNDKYRDFSNYINKFPSSLTISVIKLVSDKIVLSCNTININEGIKNEITNIILRCTIPKHKLHHII